MLAPMQITIAIAYIISVGQISNANNSPGNSLPNRLLTNFTSSQRHSPTVCQGALALPAIDQRFVNSLATLVAHLAFDDDRAWWRLETGIAVRSNADLFGKLRRIKNRLNCPLYTTRTCRRHQHDNATDDDPLLPTIAIFWPDSTDNETRSSAAIWCPACPYVFDTSDAWIKPSPNRRVILKSRYGRDHHRNIVTERLTGDLLDDALASQ